MEHENKTFKYLSQHLNCDENTIAKVRITFDI